MSIAERTGEADELIRWLDEKIDGIAIPSELRFRVAGGYLDMALEHQKSIVLLVVNHLYGSALSLVRLIFEAYVRGVWLHHCASEADLKRFEKNKLKRSSLNSSPKLSKSNPLTLGFSPLRKSGRGQP